MELTALLTEAIEKVPGAVAISLLGVDGVAVETINGAKALPGDGVEPLPEATPAWDVELADLMLGARRVSHALAWGGLRDVTLASKRLTLLARMIGPDYFLLLVLSNKANLGRARFELQRAGVALIKNL